MRATFESFTVLSIAILFLLFSLAWMSIRSNIHGHDKQINIIMEGKEKNQEMLKKLIILNTEQNDRLKAVESKIK